MNLSILKNLKPRASSLWSSQWLSIATGSLIVSIWTLIRFFNHSPNFDQVGQQVLAHQWLHGLHSGSVIGPTNYVLKMLFLYIPLDLVPLPAQFKLIFMTLLVNIATFVLLSYILQSLFREFNFKPKNSFYLPLVYLALISGSVYWISFSNSRNLEVVGGVFLIYRYIRTQANPSMLNYSLLIVLGGLLFFADPLQIYMTLLPAIIFVGLRAASKKDRRQLTVLARLIFCAGLSILLARAITLAVESVWNVSFIHTKQSLGLSSSSIKSSAEQMARLYAGGYEGGRLREALNKRLLVSNS